MTTSSGRPVSASTRCGRCSTCAATARARSSPRAASARWATAFPPRSARRRRDRTRPSICVDGDGCFQMTCQELATSVLEDLPIVVVIVNNGYLGMVRQWQDMFFEERFSQIHLTQLAARLRGARACVRRARLHRRERGGARGGARRGDRLRPHVRRRRPRRSARALLPDDPRRRSGARRRGVPGDRGAGRMKHTLSVLVENKPGALTRITSMFARRGYNIESLAVGATERHDVSRITLRVDCEHALARADREADAQARQRAPRARSSPRASRSSASSRCSRSSAPPSARAELMALGEVFGARVADLGPDTIVFELDGSPEEVDSFEELVRPHGLQELVRTGRIGLSRATRAPRGKRAAASPRLTPRQGAQSRWQPFTATATSTCSTARSPSSASAARVTRTR